MENNLDVKKVANTDQQVDSKISAIRDLIFGENIQKYDIEFDDVYAKIQSLKEENQKNLAASVASLESKLADLESLMDNKFQDLNEDLNEDLNKKIADLDDEKADRKKLGKALEKIAVMLQE